MSVLSMIPCIEMSMHTDAIDPFIVVRISMHGYDKENYFHSEALILNVGSALISILIGIMAKWAFKINNG